MKKKVLFLCTNNSARSQIAEGLLRHLYGNYYEAYSAGTQSLKINPVREPRSLTVCVDGDIKPASTLFGNDHRLKSVAFSNGVNPYAIKVMTEINIDISKQYSKGIDQLRSMKFDYVITVCDRANESCPFFPGVKSIHKNFEDPSAINGTEHEILTGFRRVRDEIEDWIIEIFGKENEAH